MSRTEIKNMLDEFFAVIETQDIEKIIDFFTEDAVLIVPGAPQYKGRKEIRKFYDEVLDPNSEVEHETTKTIIEGNDAAVVIEVKVTQKDGCTIEFPEANLFEIREGKVSKVAVFFDTALMGE